MDFCNFCYHFPTGMRCLMLFFIKSFSHKCFTHFINSSSHLSKVVLKCSQIPLNLFLLKSFCGLISAGLQVNGKFRLYYSKIRLDDSDDRYFLVFECPGAFLKNLNIFLSVLEFVPIF